MTTANTATPVVKEVTINAPASKVWKAITDRDQMKQWYFDLAEFRPEVGFEFRFIGQDHDCKEYLHICVITEVIPNKKLVHTWRYDGYEGDSLVTWELAETGNTTHVKLTHTGLDTFPAEKAFARENFNEGWTQIVSTSLKEFVEKQ